MVQDVVTGVGSLNGIELSVAAVARQFLERGDVECVFEALVGAVLPLGTLVVALAARAVLELVLGDGCGVAESLADDESCVD